MIFRLVWKLVLVSICIASWTETTLSITENMQGICYSGIFNRLFLGFKEHDAMVFSSYNFTTSYCSGSDKLLWMERIAGTSKWMVGCESEVQLRNFYVGLQDSMSFPEPTSDIYFALAYPYLSIHYKSEKIYSCGIQTSQLQCSELNFSIDVQKYIPLTTSRNDLATKTIINNQATSRIFIYSSKNSHCLELEAPIYSVTQSNYTLYVWAQTGIYSYNHQQDNGLEFMFNVSFDPLNERSLAYIDQCLLFINSNKQMIVYELGNSSMYLYDSQEHIQVFSYWRGVIVEGTDSTALRFQVDGIGWMARTTPDIGWSPIDEYQWKNLSHYTSSSPENTTNTTNTTTNATNTTGNTSTNSTNTTTEGNTTKDSLSESSSICWESCLECANNECIECSAGFTLTNGTCEEQGSFALITSLQSFPYSSVALRLVLLQFMDEFWYYEYHKYNYSEPVKGIVSYVGSVNRNKYIPPYVKDILPTLHQHYLKSKHEWGFSNTTNITTKQYKKLEQQPINFTLNTSKMYLWNYVLSLIIYLIQRGSSWICRLWGWKILRRSTVLAILLMIFLEGNVQFISFVFFQQIKQQPSALIFMDKINMIIAVMFMFVVFAYSIGSFAIFAYLLGEKKFKKLFPKTTKNKLIDMVVLMTLGPGRNLFMGFVQAFNENFTLQMVLLLALNVITLIIFKLIPDSYYYLHKIGMRCGFVVLIIIFLLCGLLNYHSLALQTSTFHILQLFCICGLWSICIIDFMFDFTSFILEGIFYFCSAPPEKQSKKKPQQSEESNNKAQPQKKVQQPPVQKVKRTKKNKSFG